MTIRLRRIRPTTLAKFIKFIAIAGVFFIIFMLFRLSAQATETGGQTKIIAERTQTIAEQSKTIAEQNNVIAAQNKRIAQDSQKHIDCIAELFARYTRDNLPITIEDLTTCQATQAEPVASSTGTTGQAPAQGDSDSTTNNTTINNPPANNGNGNGNGNPQPTTPPPAAQEHKPIEIIGIPVCVPLTNICVTR